MTQFSNDIYDAVQRNLVNHSQFTNIRNGMEEISDLSKNYRRSEGLFIEGLSGTGKTELLKNYTARHPNIRDSARLVRPVVYVEVPPKPAPLALQYSIAASFGDAYASKRSYELEKRIPTLFEQCETHTLVIDEAQHLVRGKSRDYVKQAADTIKWLMNTPKVGIILAGIPEAQKLFTVDEQQLEGRFTNFADLKRWEVVTTTKKKSGSDIDEVQYKEFVDMLFSILKKGNFEGDTTILSDAKVIRRIYFATDGRIRYMSRLIAAVLAVAIPNKVAKLEMSYFEAAFIKKIFSRAKPENNPFSPSFAERRLTLKNEPFGGEAE